MDHSDAQLHGLLGGFDLGLLPVQVYLPLKAAGRVYHRHPEQDVHQCGLASPVLPDEGKDLPFAQGEGDVLQYTVAVVLFVDTLHLEPDSSAQKTDLLCKNGRAAGVDSPATSLTIPGTGCLFPEDDRLSDDH